ncbi:MAG: 23S rRNA (pseudouridine(1915)-N(3))-methyltransferase RlmH [Clostridia bacterium]|nr:23S rRNA (pseudouridine(1915)-N(3))-methyltransferase RlmH [Clostridia bacterium]
MNITVICVGNLKEKFYKDACNEYIKRLGRFGKITIKELSESKGGNKQDIEKEGKEIIKVMPKGSFIIPLCIEGKLLSSPALADKFSELANGGISEITFIIGGSDGLSAEVKDMGNFKLSFSPMTFPHQLMRVILLEQVYRAFTIIEGTAYHK